MTLGERMKAYEQPSEQRLVPGVPAVIRLDMRAGHGFCRNLQRPFDTAFAIAMRNTASWLCSEITGAVLGYTQSDEISIAVQHTVDERDQQQFFAGRVCKIVSVTASMCTLMFNREYAKLAPEHPELHWTAQFDSRVFNLPTVAEVHNYFVWRQVDAERNSLNMAARALYSTKELHGKKAPELHDMLMAKGVNWNDLSSCQKRGTSVYKTIDIVENSENGEYARSVWSFGSPRFTQEPDLIPRLFKENQPCKN